MEPAPQRNSIVARLFPEPLCLALPVDDEALRADGHTARVLHLAQSPDGETVVSAAADETLRFWSIFGGGPTSAARCARAGCGTRACRRLGVACRSGGVCAFACIFATLTVGGERRPRGGQQLSLLERFTRQLESAVSSAPTPSPTRPPVRDVVQINRFSNFGVRRSLHSNAVGTQKDYLLDKIYFLIINCSFGHVHLQSC